MKDKIVKEVNDRHNLAKEKECQAKRQNMYKTTETK